MEREKRVVSTHFPFYFIPIVYIKIDSKKKTVTYKYWYDGFNLFILLRNQILLDIIIERVVKTFLLMENSNLMYKSAHGLGLCAVTMIVVFIFDIVQ